jgi:transposase-like protein
VAITKMELVELVRNAEGGDVDFLRESVRVLAQALMEAEVSAQIGAEHGERNPESRTAQRNGYRDRDWDTRAGAVELRIPKLRSGSYFPTFLDARRRAEKALCAVVAQCYVEAVSTRRVDDVAGRWASRVSARARSAGSAPNSTRPSSSGGPGRWTRGRTGSCGSTRWR